MESKTCTRCYRSLRLTEYARRSGASDGRRSECKRCQAKYRRARREADPEAVRRYDRETYYLHRERILARKRRDRMLTKEDVERMKR